MTWYNLFPSLVKVKKKYLYSLRLKKLDIVEFFWAVFFLNLSLVQEIDRISCGIVDWLCVTATVQCIGLPRPGVQDMWRIINGILVI